MTTGVLIVLALLGFLVGAVVAFLGHKRSLPPVGLRILIFVGICLSVLMLVCVYFYTGHFAPELSPTP